MKKFLGLLLSFSLVLNMSSTILFAEDNTIKDENTNVLENVEDNTTQKDETNSSEESSDSELPKDETNSSEEFSDSELPKDETNSSEESNKEDLQSDSTINKDEEKEENMTNINTWGVNIGLEVPNTFKTYTDPVTNVKPLGLTVSVPVKINKAGLENVTIEIPYNFTPNKSKDEFKDFSMTEPIFKLVQPNAGADSIVERYDVNSNKIIAHLKKTTLCMETLNFRFEFNEAYDAKIPENQLIGYGIKAIVKDSSGTEIGSTKEQEIYSDTKDGMYVAISRSNPIDDKLKENKILCRFQWYNTYREYLLLDATNPDNNKLYIEVPTGSKLQQNLIDFFGTNEITSEEDTTIPSGYSRYYRTVTDDKKTFNVWHYNGNVNNCHGQMDASVQLPDNIKLGENVHIKLGICYKKINSKLKEYTKQVDYVKTERSEWEFIKSDVHSNPNGSIKTTVIQGNKEQVANTEVWAGGYYNYNHRLSMKNESKNPIKKTEMYLKQPEKSSGKINFNEIEAMSRADNGAKKGIVKVKLEIKNAKTGLIRSVLSGSGNIVNVNIPKLENNEYIDKVIVTPMGTDGKSEGDFASRNSILIRYRAKSWPTNFWPDGTPIDNNPVNMSWCMNYLDETKGKEPSMKTLNGKIHQIYYVSEKTIQAKTAFVSSDAKDKKTGEEVSYSIEGYNGINATGNWENPEIGVAIPKVLELQNPESTKTFIDKINNVEYKNAVKVTLVSSDEAYNYYKFNVEGTAYKNNSNLSFSIPLKFKIKNGATAGIYKIPYTVASSSTSFEQIETTQKDPDIDTAFKYDESKLYSIFRSGNTDLVIADLTDLTGTSSARKDSLDEWTNITNFLVEQGGTPQMKASIYNRGNTIFEKVRLYNILPKNGDNRGSTGNISFTGLSVKIEQIAETLGIEEQPTVYYTTKDELPGYNTDLQTWDSTKLNDLGFTINKPSDLSNVTAIYIDFGNNKINPREKFEAILDFKVPQEANQKAVNQFLYSAKVAETENILNASSNKITFSTEVGEVCFDENLPEIFKNNPNNKVSAENMPESLSTSLDLSGKGEVTLPNKDNNPTLFGHEFSHWEYNDKRYNPGDKIIFKSGSEKITLKAIWTPKKINITYNKNFGDESLLIEKEYKFGDKVNSNDIAHPTRAGYTFLGWSESNTATSPDFEGGSIINFENDKIVYAVWKANTYTIKFDANGGTGTMGNQIMTYDVFAPLNKNTFTREGYIFKGWNIKANKVSSILNRINSAVTYQDEENVKNLTVEQNGIVTLEAVWEKGSYGIIFDSQGGSNVEGQNIEYGSTLTKPENPTKEGYTFSGWYKDKECTEEWNFETEKMPAKNMTLYAKWIVNSYKVTFDSQGGTPIEEKEIVYNEIFAKPEKNPTREGYTFGGWYKDKECTEEWNFETEKMPSKDITLYAKWNNTPPTITANDEVELELNSEFNPLNGVSASDREDGTIDNIEVVKNTVDTSKVGNYNVTYKVTDKAGVSIEKIIKVIVYANLTDINNIPVISAEDVMLTVGEKFEALNNVTARDVEDGDITNKIEVEGTVDTSKAGTYNVTYKVTDSNGALTIKTITVTVNPKKAEVVNVAPIILANDVTLTVGDKFEELKDVIASDKEDGDITKDIEVIENTVDTSKSGTYKVTYKVIDSNGVSTTKTITVTVKDIISGGGTNPDGGGTKPDPNPEKPNPEPEKPNPEPENPDDGNEQGGQNKPENPEEQGKPDEPNAPEQNKPGDENKPDEQGKPENPNYPEEPNKPNSQNKPGSQNTPETQNQSDTTDKSDAPKTGDESNIGLYAFILVISAIGLLVLNLLKKKTLKNK